MGCIENVTCFSSAAVLFWVDGKAETRRAIQWTNLRNAMAEKVPLNVNGDNNGGVVMFSEVMVPFVSDRGRNGVEWKGEKCLRVSPEGTSAKIVVFLLPLVRIWL